MGGFISQTLYSESKNLDEKIRSEAFTTFFKVIDQIPRDFMAKKGMLMIEEMPKDNVNEIKMTFVWNLPKISKHLDYVDFQSKILPVIMKNLKSKNRFIKEDTYGALGETLNSLIDKSAEERQKIFE